MATNDMRDPREEQQEMREIEGPGRAWFAWVWICVLIVGIAFFWFAGWGWGGYGGWLWGGPRTTAIALPSGSGVLVLNANNKAAYVGHAITLHNVMVDRQVNSRVLWIRSRKSEPMLVVLTSTNANTGNRPLTPGEVVSVAGVVQKAPPATQAEQDWQLNQQGTQKLEEQQAYLQATGIEEMQPGSTQSTH